LGNWKLDQKRLKFRVIAEIRNAPQEVRLSSRLTNIDGRCIDVGNTDYLDGGKSNTVSMSRVDSESNVDRERGGVALSVIEKELAEWMKLL